MDSSFDNLPYQIPGPAGGVSYPTPSQERRGELNKDDASRIFRQPPWHALLHHLRAPPFGGSRLQSSVALLRSHALSDRFQRVTRLAVLIDALSWVGRDASVKLRDPTGLIRATLHAEVFDKWKTGIEHGAGLLLDGVAAVAYVERRPKGFRTDTGEALHVSIQLCHVMEVFPVGKGVIGKSAGLIVNEPRESYAHAAIAPPVIKRPHSRRAPPPAQPQRVPLRPRQEHHGSRPMRRPTSAGGHASYRGGFKGHPQQPRHPMTHANHRPPQGYQPNKRPFTPHHVGPPPGVRRPGMQPLPKRPAPHRPPAPVLVSPLIVPPATAVDSLTDDQLDDLLGDFDVDAVIAASGKSQALVISSATGSKQQSEAVLDKSRSSVPTGNGPPSGSPVALPSNDGSDLGSKPESNSESNDASNAKSRSVGLSNAAKSVFRVIANAEANSGGAGPKSLCAVDDAMIDNLLEGLDSSDFG